MTVIRIIEWALFGLVTTGITIFALMSLYQNNRLLFKCLLAVLVAYVLTISGVYGAGMIFKKKQDEIRVVFTIVKAPEPEKKKEIKLPDQLDLPFGLINGKRNVTKVPKGSRSAKPGQQSSSSRPMTSGFGPDGDIATNPDAKGDIFGPSDYLSRDDISTGTGGERWGDPDGEGDGPPPAGFEQGKVGGRVYFIRMKHGTGAWNAYNDGTKKLLSYLNLSFPCQSESWPIASGEIRNKYLNKGALPSFLYLYCDESFSLNDTDVAVLRDYMHKGGFLFLDSRPSPDVKERVQKELDKVLPGMRLSVLSARHPINSALYKLSVPGIGSNYVEQKNYGVTSKDGRRLVVFYTPGNFSQLYDNYNANHSPYMTAQYQMGANVMIYAITKGDVGSIQKKAGANATVTKQVLESLGLLGGSGSGGSRKEGESVKVKPTNPNGEPVDPSKDPEQPDEIILD